jgi:hypothetical protein
LPDYLFVSFFHGHHQGDAARRLVQRHGLSEVAKIDRLGDLHMGVRLTLPAGDARLEPLLAELRAQGVRPLTRLDRVHTQHELDHAEWLVLRVGTVGLYGGVDYGQAYSFAHACETCGAGAVPIAPLTAELSAMGKKDVDHLVYEGHLIVTRRVAEGLAGLTGFESAPVKLRRKPPDDRFSWLKIDGSLPEMHSATTGYKSEGACPTCGRGGHYDDYDAPEAPVYDQVPATACDFNHTFEYFGDWRQVRSPSQTRPVGGAPGIVVSQRVRQALRQLGVRRLVWVPVDTIAYQPSNTAEPLQPAASRRPAPGG